MSESYKFFFLLIMMYYLINHVNKSYAQNNLRYNIDDSKIALQGYSPVSYLELATAEKGLKEFKSEYDKVFYYFTSAEQKEKFDKNPKKYLPEYGGYCAFGMCMGMKLRPDPEKFLVKDNKYYLFLNNLEMDAKQKWLEGDDQDQKIKAAEVNWRKFNRLGLISRSKK